MSKPTVEELVELLRKLVHWEQVAIHLPGIDQSDIDKIKKDNSKTDDQKQVLYDKWLRVYPDASWEDVIRALEKEEENTRAVSLREKFHNTETQTALERPRIQKPKPVTSSEACDPVSVVPVLVEDVVMKQLNDLHRDFLSLTGKLEVVKKQSIHLKDDEHSTQEYESPDFAKLLDSAIYETIPFLKSMLKNQQQLFFKFCLSLGLDQDFSQQIFSSAGPDINSCLKEALTEWRKNSHCTNPLKNIARALGSSTGVDITMEDDDYVMIDDTMEISLHYFSDIPDSTSQGNHPIYDILCSLPNSSKLNSEPEYRDFDTHIATKLPLKWERFGTHLKMPQPDLEIIRANRPGDIVMCFHDLFNKWKRSSCSSFTWSTALAVLCYLDEYRVAKDLCKYL